MICRLNFWQSKSSYGLYLHLQRSVTMSKLPASFPHAEIFNISTAGERQCFLLVAHSICSPSKFIEIIRLAVRNREGVNSRVGWFNNCRHSRAGNRPINQQRTNEWMNECLIYDTSAQEDRKRSIYKVQHWLQIGEFSSSVSVLTGVFFVVSTRHS